MLWVVIWVFVALGMPEPGLEPGEQAATPNVALVFAALIAAVFAAEKWFTLRHCRNFIRNFIPKT